jgi:3-phenylpropionate/cinnamic acid dioxygenase small subunit
MTEHEDRQDISDVINRFATGIDRRDWPLFRTAFSDDCHVTMGDYGSFDGVDAIARFEEASHAQAGHTLHRLSNHAIDVEGNHATARTYVDAWIMAVDNASGINAIGYYDDELIRIGDGWRIARRTFTQVRLAVVND